jgi:hypothetical protein
LGHEGKRIEIALAEEIHRDLSVGQRACDTSDRLGLCLGGGQSRFGLTLRTKNRRLALAFCAAYLRFTYALRFKDGCPLSSFGCRYRGATLALGTHLELHRLLDILWRLDRL